MASKLNQEMAEKWKEVRAELVSELVSQAKHPNTEEEKAAAEQLLRKGITRAVDEYLATADKKEKLINQEIDYPSLEGLADKSRSSQKDQIIAELIDAGYPMSSSMLQKLSSKELQQVKAQFRDVGGLS